MTRLVTPARSIATPLRDQEQQYVAGEVAGVARCPLCHWPMIIRMSCRGPYYQCLCHESGSGVRQVQGQRL
jgi:hypothetical protein